METNFTNYELNFSEKTALRIIMHFHTVRFCSSEQLNDFTRLGLVTRKHNRKGVLHYAASLQGKMYLRRCRKERVRFLIPVVISILALLRSYEILNLQILYEILQAISSLVKNVLESLGGLL